MFEVGDEVKVNREAVFKDKELIVSLNWWKELEEIEVLTISSIRMNALSFYETDYEAMSTWVVKV